MNELNGYGEDEQLNGFFKRIKKRLKKVVKSKAFKIIAIAAAATGVGMLAGPALYGMVAKKAAFKVVASRLRKKVRKAGKGVINRKIAGRKPPPSPRLQAAVKRDIGKLRTLPPQQREAALYNSPAIMANAERRVKYQVQPYFQDQYISRGMPPARANVLANRDANIMAKETMNDIKKTAAPKSNLVPIIGAAAAMLMLKG